MFAGPLAVRETDFNPRTNNLQSDYGDTMAANERTEAMRIPTGLSLAGPDQRELACRVLEGIAKETDPILASHGRWHLGLDWDPDHPFLHCIRMIG